MGLNQSIDSCMHAFMEDKGDGTTKAKAKSLAEYGQVQHPSQSQPAMTIYEATHIASCADAA